MVHPILSLHHVTATVDEAQADVDFCAGALGLRLVKKTVNFDNHHVYHFYYGNAHGTPGTIWTTFPYRGHGVRTGSRGAGQVTTTSFAVPAGSLEFWRARLASRGIVARDAQPRFGHASLLVTDPSGLVFELVETSRDPRAPWTGGGVDADTAIRGLHSVTLTVRHPERTVSLMTSLLGFRVVDEIDGRIRLGVNSGEAGSLIDVVHDLASPPGVNGLGTVHHVAMAIATSEQQAALREELIELGAHVTPVMDRCYFQSIYFREPGGVLFEVATMAPGFLIDEPESELGRALKLPPWEEANRQAIEAGLPPVTTTPLLEAR
jgi:glyoxalase family protein